MSTTEPDKNKKNDGPEIDDELESLSEDEKAAFEKIMAEIGAANGAPSREEETSDAVPSDTGSEEASTPDTVIDEPETDDDQVSSTHALDEQRLETGDTESLSQEQQASLDEIMAEIESKRKGEKKEAPLHEAVDDTPETEETSGDQQAALEKIMTEIAAKRSREKSNPSDAPEPDESENATAEASDDDLEKLVADIKSGRAKHRNDHTDGALPETESLSMEEFDDELSHLLNTAQTTPPERPKRKLRAIGTETGPDNNNREAETLAAASAPDALDESPAAANTDLSGDYPMLHEVPVGGDGTDSPETDDTQPFATGVSKPPKRKRAWLGATIAAGLVLLGATAYWSIGRWFDGPAPLPVSYEQPSALAVSSTTSPALSEQAPDSSGAANTPAVAPVPAASTTWTDTRHRTSERPSFALLQSELSAARTEIQNKISDIQQLKSYYARGITEEITKIEASLESDRIPTLEQAMADTRIELSLRAIQRRNTYMAKLDTPLAQLAAMSEELLYMERRARIYEILDRGIAGLPIDDFRQETASITASHLQYNTQISIDRVEVPATPINEIWRTISSEIRKKASLLAQRTPLNRAISAEICKGNFDRKSMLTALSPETAGCLVNWSGKDLYLNELIELTPEVAQILSQWPGEWLSLNGIKELHDDAARHLSQWPGKRLSLNGLTALSPTATTHLSQWQGAQLEMVGLQSIGRWSNYGTRLFLSENLKRQLEAQ